MKTNIKVIRTYKDLYGLNNYVLFEQKNKSYKLCVNRNGYFFQSDTQSDYICIYSDSKFVSEYIKPKYITNFFAKLLKKHGESGLREFQNNLI